MILTPKRKAVRCSNTLTTIKESNTQNYMSATDFIAAGIPQEGSTAHFPAKPCAGIDWQQYRAAGAVLQFLPVLENTMESAGNLPDSEVFSRPEFKDGLTFQGIYGFGRDGLVRKAGRMADSMFSTSRPPVALEKAASGLQSQSGAETMATVNTTPTPATGNPSALTRQQAIENALSDALHLVRTSDSQHGIQAATGRAIRAASMLKQACSELATARRSA